jgi:hypothetical protein
MFRRRDNRVPGPAVLPVLLFLMLFPVAAAPAGAQPAEPVEPVRPVQIVVLVDQSGSLSDEDVARERDAVRVIVQGEPSPGSTVSVVGFGSADRPGQAAVDQVCPRTQLDTPQKREALADCVGLLHARTAEEGDGTDHVNALRQALSDVRMPAPASLPKIVYLLTDGKLDVSKSPAYGDNSADRNRAAGQQIPGVLAELSRAGAAVWPLGFGTADKAQLDGFATGAAQDGCGLRTPKPSATVITSSADLLKAVGDASSAARCTGVGELVSGALPSGGNVDVSVDIPTIATDGSIIVFKGDRRVAVGYLDPQGTAVPSIGERGISRFALSGQNTEVEALHVVNPEPGRWTVRLSSAPDVPRLDIHAVVIFQGAVRAVIAVSPPAPRPGTEAVVTMQVRGARSPITDPVQLRGLAFVVSLTGEGFAPVPAVELADADGDGQYQGTIIVPASATGRLDFAGNVSGIGVSGDERVNSTRIARAGAGDVQAVLSLDAGDAKVVIGSSLHGTARVTNTSGQPRMVRLEVVDQSPGTVVSVEPAQLQVPAAGNAVLDFTVRFDPATTRGSNQALLRLVDDADGTPVQVLLFVRNVVAEPGFARTYRWPLLLAGALLSAGAAAAVHRVRRSRAEQDVRGVRAELRRHGDVVDELRANLPGPVFEFGLNRAGGASGFGLTPRGGDERYQVRRSRGGLTVTGPAASATTPTPRVVLELTDGVQLVVVDRRTAPRGRPAARQPQPARAADADLPY